MNDAEITLIRYRMDRSKEALSAARLMYEKGHYNDAVNRLYYSCFYAVIALLATEGVHPGKHTAVRAFLNKNWIKTGKLSKETGWLYTKLTHSMKPSLIYIFLGVNIFPHIFPIPCNSKMLRRVFTDVLFRIKTEICSRRRSCSA